MGLRAFLLMASAVLLLNCQRAPEEAAPEEATPVEATPKPAPPRADLVTPGAGPVQEEVSSAQRVAASEGRRVVVYVGASWCEPCKYFLESIEANTLPRSFADLRFLKFDHDADEERLNNSGYGGQMIPRFVVPGADGAATDKRFEGSTKGPQAMDNIVPRLERILKR